MIPHNGFFLMIHGDATHSIPNGDAMYEFSYRLANEPEKLLEVRRKEGIYK